jgi:hypothetical protein
MRSLKERDPLGVSNDDHVPNLSEVPVKALLCRLKRAASAENWRVDDLDGLEWDFTRGSQLSDGANTEDVNQKDGEWPNEPWKAADVLGGRGVGLRFGLVCGLVVHGESVAQKEGFNRRKRRGLQDRDVLVPYVNEINAPAVEVPNVTPECKGIRKTEAFNRSVHRSNRGVGNETRLLQPIGGADAEDIKYKGQHEPKEPIHGGGALGPDRVGLDFNLVCGLFVHAESVAQDRRFNRRKGRKQRETVRHELHEWPSQGRHDMDAPDVETASAERGNTKI